MHSLAVDRRRSFAPDPAAVPHARPDGRRARYVLYRGERRVEAEVRCYRGIRHAAREKGHNVLRRTYDVHAPAPGGGDSRRETTDTQIVRLGQRAVEPPSVRGVREGVRAAHLGEVRYDRDGHEPN